MTMERDDSYKHKFDFYTEVAQVKRGQAYHVGDAWLMTSKPKSPPYCRARQKRRNVGIIEKALQEE